MFLSSVKSITQIIKKNIHCLETEVLWYITIRVSSNSITLKSEVYLIHQTSPLAINKVFVLVHTLWNFDNRQESSLTEIKTV